MSLTFLTVISVIIPTCDRNDLLARCLTALSPARQTFPAADYQVIVSDDGFARDARQLVQQEYSWVRWVPGPRKGPASNRNCGAREAAGDWLAFVDDDCVPDPAWIEEIFRAIQIDAPDIIEGKTICPEKRDDPFEEHVENLTGGLYWSCNLAVRRTVFLQLHGFDEDFLQAGGEDMEFAWRIKKLGLRTAFASRAVVFHPVRRLTWKRIWWRTFLMRWILLYQLKTEQSLPLTASRSQAVVHLAWTRFLDLLRLSKQLAGQLSKPFWRRKLFFLFWNWFTFPILLPYLMLWEVRFRELLSSRACAESLRSP